MSHELMETYRYIKGKKKARATYRPDDCILVPWIIEIEGGAIVYKETLIKANAWLTHRGFKLVED